LRGAQPTGFFFSAWGQVFLYLLGERHEFQTRASSRARTAGSRGLGSLRACSSRSRCSASRTISALCFPPLSHSNMKPLAQQTCVVLFLPTVPVRAVSTAFLRKVNRRHALPRSHRGVDAHVGACMGKGPGGCSPAGPPAHPTGARCSPPPPPQAEPPACFVGRIGDSAVGLERREWHRALGGGWAPALFVRKRRGSRGAEPRVHGRSARRALTRRALPAWTQGA